MSIEPEQFLLLGGAILIGALLVLGGALIGLRARRKNDGASDDPHAPAQAEMPPPAAAAELPQTKRESPARLSDWQRKLPPDVILLNRDAATGEWLVEIEGQRYRRLSEIHDDKAASKIAGALEGLRVFAGLAAPAASEPASVLADGQPVAGARAGSPLPPPTGSRRSGQATYPAPEGSIISQIEVLLQRELGLHADLRDRNIHMGALPDGSLIIEVDTGFYRSPDEIPDAQVRDIVLMAVRTWEKSS